MENGSDKNRLLEIANDIIEKEGVKGLNVAKLVSECKISKSTFYKHFTSKEALLLELKSSMKQDAEKLYTTREKIIQQAIKEFSNNLFDQIEIDAIARAVGIKRSSIYRYFSSKEDLLVASLEYEIQNRIKLREYFEHTNYDPNSFLQKLFDYGIVFYEKKYNNLMFYNALYYSKSNVKIQTILENLWKQTTDMIEYIFDRGKLEGVLKLEADSKTLAQMTISYIGGSAIFACQHYDILCKQYINLILRDIVCL